MVSVSGISRTIKAAGKLIFMDPEFSKIAENTLKASRKAQGWNSIHKQVWNSFKTAEARTYKDSFWKNLWNKQILGFPKDISNAWITGKGIWGTTKAIGGKVLQRLPILFTLFELPNIFSAFKDEGLIGGTIETIKSGTKIAGSMAGFMVGQTLIPIPIVGGLIGAIGADWLLGKVLGKSHSEKKAEQEEAIKQGDAQQYQELQEQMQKLQQQNPFLFQQNPGYQTQTARLNIPRATMNPQQIMMLQQQLYGGGGMNPMDQDFMQMTSGMNRLGQNLNYYG